ncbi:CubicO group peptidase, beta-lactamase class C family [Geodermatophilus dictyosporus]|uniref:CubicO group peptidase, beta-lactamase class C family n=1 Tax=Geodermatophilus dictyosporus TaxID=1523247 RepID=A0A1I5JN59_9ACTN|nr:serine hydrolase domain-containing protein [Geodermatophilus dictyosporus]SFO74242.1 CubicO group peptidase, beta-lactamase class C family [Geodermatophilus dictyosporus]
MDANVTEALTRAADSAARRHVGLALGVVDARSGETAVAGRGSSGRPDGRPVDAATLFEIGSVTKTVTALVLADAVVRGEVRLDTPLRETVPAGVRVPSRDGVDVTLEHLATHRSGLPHSPMGWVPVLRSAFSTDDPYAGVSVPGLYDALGHARLRRTPGTGRPRYSNFAAAVLGQALADHLGHPDYASLVRDRVCGPLGLRDTVVVPTAAQAERLAVGHGRRRRPIEPWYLLGLAGAGALRSTTDDLLTYLRAHLRPGSTPLAEALALTQQERHRSRLTGGTALAWMRWPSPGGPVLLHGGATGGFRAATAFAPDAGLGVVALSNSTRNPEQTAVRLLLDLTRTGATRSGHSPGRTRP